MMREMREILLNWDDILEVGQGGPGCGQLYINGRQPKGGWRFLPPALVHEGRVYASTFVPGGFVLCEIDPATLVRRAISPRLDYARLEAVEEGALVYADSFAGDGRGRHPIAPQAARGRWLKLPFGRR